MARKIPFGIRPALRMYGQTQGTGLKKFGISTGCVGPTAKRKGPIKPNISTKKPRGLGPPSGLYSIQTGPPQRGRGFQLGTNDVAMRVLVAKRGQKTQLVNRKGAVLTRYVDPIPEYSKSPPGHNPRKNPIPVPGETKNHPKRLRPRFDPFFLPPNQKQAQKKNRQWKVSFPGSTGTFKIFLKNWGNKKT